MIIAVIAVLLLLVELGYFKVARKYGITASPVERSSHSVETITGGGVVFYCSMLLYSLFYGVDYPWMMSGLTCVALVSMIDDIKPQPSSLRMIVQFIAIGLLAMQWGIGAECPWWYAVCILVLGTGFLNAYNFMDGITGMTGLYSLSVLVPLYVLNEGAAGEFVDPQLLWCLLVSVIVFCFFNLRRKPVCFSGDVGAVSIGFVLLFVLGLAIQAYGNSLWMVVFVAVYGVDAVLTICHRLLEKENIFEPHRKHVYQLLANELHIRQGVISTCYAVGQLAVSLGAIYLDVNRWYYMWTVLAVLAVAYVLFIKKYYHLYKHSR